ncbi:MAG: FHA domain-containing protein [Polyangiales bacterium]
MLRLIQEFGAHAGRQFTFNQERVKLGRQPTCDVAFDPNVDLDASGNHCEIRRENGQYLIVDLQSRNGTFVNGTRISSQPLRSGDLVECGRGGPRFRVEIQGASAPVQPGPFGAPQPAAAFTGPMQSPAANPFAGPAQAPQPPHAAPSSQPAQSQPFGAPPAFHPANAHVPPAHGAPLPPPNSVGGAVAAQLPAGAKVGKATVAMMIDQALAASEQRRGMSTGAKVGITFGVIALLAVVGGSVAYVVSQPSPSTDSSGQSNHNSAQGGEQITSQYEAAIYLLAAQVPGTPNPRGFCTGFAVTHDLIATNAHCIDAGREFLQRGSTLIAMRSSGRGERVAVVPVYRDSRFRNATFGSEGSGFDVGLVRASAPLPTQVRVAPDAELLALRAGSSLFVYGFPGLTMNETSPVATITQGVLNRTTDFFERAADPASAQKIQHSAQTTSGSSGSPIFLASGAVIGINAGSLSDEERQRILDPRTGQTVSVEVNRSSNFKYGMRADIIRAAVAQVGETLP